MAFLNKLRLSLVFLCDFHHFFSSSNLIGDIKCTYSWHFNDQFFFYVCLFVCIILCSFFVCLKFVLDAHKTDLLQMYSFARDDDDNELIVQLQRLLHFYFLTNMISFLIFSSENFSCFNCDFF